MIVRCGLCGQLLAEDGDGALKIHVDMTADGSMNDIQGPFILYCPCRQTSIAIDGR